MWNEPEKYGLTPFGPCPNARHMEWYRRGKTAFLHFTVNTFTSQEWGDGTEDPAIFAPTQLDCRQWLQVLKEAGFTAAILTAKHHDGFCLWPSRYTEHSVKQCACGDVVKQFTDACREYGIKAGLYLSPWDRNHPQWGTDAYNDYYANQLTELMTQYGTIWECWWDGAGSTKAHYDWKRWSDIVRTHQSQCVIFGCLGAAEHVDVRWVGNETGTAGDPCYATIEPESVLVENTDELNSGKPDGSRFIPAETNTSIRPGWFYHAHQDDQVKSPEELVDYWFRAAGRNTAILLNLPPDKRGLIHEKDAASVIAWQRLLERIFARNLAEGSRVSPGGEALLSKEENRIYISDTLCPVVEFAFRRSVTFDCFRVDEVIELGHRVRHFRLDAMVDGSWVTVAQKGCIGFCCSHRIAPVTTDRVRLVITEAAAPPVLRFFGLYHAGEILSGEQGQTAGGELTGLQFHREGNALIVDLGGIYPCNAMTFRKEGIGRFTLHAFNGTRYVPVLEGTGEQALPCRFPTVQGSYKLKLEITDGILPEDHGFRLFYE